MRDYGDTDDAKKLIRINAKKSKKSGRGELLDTITHEIIHAKHNKMHEKTVYKQTPKEIKKMSQQSKRRLYELIK